MKKQTIKSIIFSLIFLIISVLFWFSLASFLKNPVINRLISIVILFFLWAAILGIHCVIIKNKKIFYLTFLLSIISFLIFFPFNKYYLIGLFVLLIAMVIGRNKIIKEANSRLKISVSKSLKSGFFIILFFLFLFISFIFYLNPPLIQTGEFKLPRSWFKLIEGPLGGILNKSLPFPIPQEMTIDEISAIGVLIEQGKMEKLLSSLSQKIPQSKISTSNPEELLKIIKEDPELQKAIVEQIRKESKNINPSLLEKQRKELSKTFGLNLEGDKSVSDVLYDLANEKINQFIAPNRKYVSLIFAILLFILLEQLLIIIKPIIFCLANILFTILFWTKFIKIEKEIKEAEAIKL